MSNRNLVLMIMLFSISISANNSLLIDVRTINEFESGHIEDSLNIELQNISSITNKITTDQKIYLYCRSGRRSQKATEILLELGYKDVTNLGGIKEASEVLNKKIIQ
tara:strand:+ start:231 stop:551 length:321 start_codon:yes stop_codon:yes gene_type:complete